MNQKQIDQKYRKQHSDLETRYYKNGEISKEEFDLLHGELWDSHKNELVEAGLITIPEPPRDLKTELDELKARVKSLEGRNGG